MIREINIKVTYEINVNSQLQITPPNITENIVYENLVEYFADDEKFIDMEVVCNDKE